LSPSILVLIFFWGHVRHWGPSKIFLTVFGNKHTCRSLWVNRFSLVISMVKYIPGSRVTWSYDTGEHTEYWSVYNILSFKVITFISYFYISKLMFKDLTIHLIISGELKGCVRKDWQGGAGWIRKSDLPFIFANTLLIYGDRRFYQYNEDDFRFQFRLSILEGWFWESVL